MNEIIYCPWDAPTFLFISENVPPLIHYSHFIAIFAATAIALLVFLSNRKEVISKLFLLFSSLFTVWALLDVILWATNDPGVVKFAWSMQVLIEPITYGLAFYLFYIFVYKKIPPFWVNLTVTVLLFPLILFLPTRLNLQEVYLSSCEFAEGPLALYYTYFLNLLFTIAIVVTMVMSWRHVGVGQHKSKLYFGIGLITFLLSFTSGNLIGSFTDDWTVSQYGLFGMPIFASIIAYSIVRFNTFRIQVAGAPILVVVLWAFVASLLFVQQTQIKLIAGLTLAFTTAAGFMLIRSVRKEVQQRERIEQLAKDLRRANDRLKVLDKMKSEFVSIASHQLRSPLTSIRGYASMLLEGSYGPIPAKAHEALERIAESSKYMVDSVEDYLNVSRIESGNMKYELSDFNLKDQASIVVGELRTVALKKGLLLTFRSSLTAIGIVHADIGKVRQALHNLINNSIKYTERGSIVVSVTEDTKKKRVYVSISDTGVGMNEETLNALFAKFSRAKNANEVNISGTGLGLYVAKQMVEQMGGTITASSEGEGKGSVFTLELPLLQ